MEKEIWKDIQGYEGLYQVSNLGRVKSLERYEQRLRCGKYGMFMVKERILRQNICGSGYYKVYLCKDGIHKQRMVHRLVAEAFLQNSKNYKEVNHKDENKLNNNLDNLEWCNRIYNRNYGTATERHRQALIGHRLNSKNPNACKVICDGIIFGSIKECGEYYNILPRTLYGYFSKNKFPKIWIERGLAYV